MIHGGNGKGVEECSLEGDQQNLTVQRSGRDKTFMEMEGRDFPDLYRNSSEEIFLKSLMDNSSGMLAPTMEMLGFKNLSQSFCVDSEELFNSWLTNGEVCLGDVDELLMLRKKGLGKSSRLEVTGVRLDQEFELFILTANYMTEKDEIIRETNLSERMQMLAESTGPSPTDDLNIEEGAWIHNQLITNYKGLLFNDRDDLVPSELSTKIKEDIVRFFAVNAPGQI